MYSARGGKPTGPSSIRLRFAPSAVVAGAVVAGAVVAAAVVTDGSTDSFESECAGGLIGTALCIGGPMGFTATPCAGCSAGASPASAAGAGSAAAAAATTDLGSSSARWPAAAIAIFCARPPWPRRFLAGRLGSGLRLRALDGRGNRAATMGTFREP